MSDVDKARRSTRTGIPIREVRGPGLVHTSWSFTTASRSKSEASAEPLVSTIALVLA